MMKKYSVFVGVNGFYSPRIRHDAVWNRVANITGGAGKNIAYDLANEFINNEFKGIYYYLYVRVDVLIPYIV